MKFTRLSFRYFLALCNKAKAWFPVLLQLTFGILVGTLLGFSLRVEYESEAVRLDSVPQLRSVFLSSNVSLSSITLRCVIYIDKEQKKIEKYVSALRDSYIQRCDYTIVITNAKDVYKKFAKLLNVVYMKNWKSEFYWEMYRLILQYLTKNEKNAKKSISFDWTIIGNEQLYVVIENLKKYLLDKNSKDRLIFGSILNRRNLLSFIFPFGSYTAISVKAGVIFSEQALIDMQSSTCSGLFFPSGTEEGIYECASKVGISVTEPRDENGMRLLHSKNVKNLIKLANSGNVEKNSSMQVDCCSDSAISFGDLSYNDIRLLEYSINKFKVFGIRIS